MPVKVPVNPTDEQMQDLVTLSGYQHSSRCSICNAKHPVTGVPVRGDIEDVYSRMGLKNAMAFAKTMNVTVGARQLQRHVESHAPYVRAGAWIKKTRQFIKDAMEEHQEADTAIQTIINVGTKMVEEGEMPISEKLYIEALKMKSKEKRVIPLAGFIDAVEGEVFDGEVMTEEPLLLPGGRKKKQDPVKNNNTEENTNNE